MGYFRAFDQGCNLKHTNLNSRIIGSFRLILGLKLKALNCWALTYESRISAETPTVFLSQR